MVDFKELSALTNAARVIAAQERPDYDAVKIHRFTSGFLQGHRQAEKNPFNQELDSSALEDIKHLDVAEKAAYISGFNRGFNYRLENIDKNTSKSEKNHEKISVSQENFVSLQKENIYDYDTNSNRRAEEVASADYAGQRYDRLGVHAYQTQGKPTLDNRWDTELYEEGLRYDLIGNQLGSPRFAVRTESERLIQVAKQKGDYIPSSVWDTFGRRVTKPSGESIVFTDAINGRVVKFKDPFAYISLKGDNPFSALYEHHIHNYFFADVNYRLLGLSQDPISGDVRFAFEQPYIQAEQKTTNEEITKWFKDRGFKLTKDGFWFTDGNVSFTDVWGDNCIKDNEGNFHFIDPIIKFEKEPKEVIAHYVERDRELSEKLDMAGIKVGTRFRIDRLCSFNDMQVKDINLAHGLITFFHPTTHPDYQGEFEWPISRVLDNIKLSQGSRWIQVDDNRNDIVIPAAKQALVERAKDPSPHAVFTDSQLKALDRYCTLYSENTPKQQIFQNLLNDTQKELKNEHIYPEWVGDMHDELMEYANGHRREDNGLKLK